MAAIPITHRADTTVFGRSYSDTMSQPLQQSLRINNLVVDPSSIAPKLQQLGYTAEGWMPYQTGWRRPAIITEEVRQFEDLQAASGTCYVQNASSWLPPLFCSPSLASVCLICVLHQAGKPLI